MNRDEINDQADTYTVQGDMYTASVYPKAVGFWCLYERMPRVQFAMYQKPTDEQIKNTTELLGWIWEDAK